VAHRHDDEYVHRHEFGQDAHAHRLVEVIEHAHGGRSSTITPRSLGGTAIASAIFSTRSPTATGTRWKSRKSSW